MSRPLPSSITRQNILEAIERFEGGQQHAFGPSTFYDLVWQGKRYPPKAIVGLAAESVTGTLWYPMDFEGGEDTPCVRLLRELGFTIARKIELDLRASYGHPFGVTVGQRFESRKELREAGVHSPLQAGIQGSAEDGAVSIVLSGGYEDDEDLGDVIIYTGQGGQENGRQVADQQLVRGNAALAQSCNTGWPIRVVRGANHRSSFSPEEGYRYDGLFRVESYWQERGRSGHLVYRFRLEQLPTPPEIETAAPTISAPLGSSETLRRTASVVRVVRDTAVSRWVKALYKNQCQVCGDIVRVQGGTYSEGAHIKPLGNPHNGPDQIENVLCLCPNHHVMLDRGGLSIADDLSLMGLRGALIVKPAHCIDRRFLQYHRSHHGFVDVVAGVFSREGKVMMARRAPGKRSAGRWEFPGGKINVGETAQEALARELREEFGLQNILVGALIADSTSVVGNDTIRLRSYHAVSDPYPTGSTDHDAVEWRVPEALCHLELCPPDIETVNALLQPLRAPMPKGH